MERNTNADEVESDGKLHGDVENGSKVSIAMMNGKDYTGELVAIDRVTNFVGFFSHHEICVDVDGIGTVWVSTHKNAGNEGVRIDASSHDKGAWDKSLGELYSIVFQSKKSKHAV